MLTVLLGLVLIGGIFLFGWLDYRRNARIPHIGLIMVKNRLSSSDHPGTSNQN